MKKTYVLICAAIVVALSVVTASAQASIILAQWTVETSPPADLLNSAVGPTTIADAGVMGGQLGGVHAKTVSDWTTPSGNGSANSYSSNEWSVGDYYAIATSTIGYDTLTLTFDATGSNTGPKDFEIQVSADGTTFSPIGYSYALTNDAWSSSTGNPVSTRTTALPSSLDNQSAIFVRFVNTSTVAVNGGAVATGGTSRVDNIIVSGELIPEPASIALLFGCLGIMALRRS